MSTSRISSLLTHVRYGTIDPVRDWLVALTFFLIVLAGIIVWNMWAFDTVANGGTIGAKPAVAPTIDESSLDTIHAILESRATEATKYVTGEYRYTDPSI